MRWLAPRAQSRHSGPRMADLLGISLKTRTGGLGKSRQMGDHPRPCATFRVPQPARAGAHVTRSFLPITPDRFVVFRHQVAPRLSLSHLIPVWERPNIGGRSCSLMGTTSCTSRSERASDRSAYTPARSIRTNGS